MKNLARYNKSLTPSVTPLAVLPSFGLRASSRKKKPEPNVRSDFRMRARKKGVALRRLHTRGDTQPEETSERLYRAREFAKKIIEVINMHKDWNGPGSIT